MAKLILSGATSGSISIESPAVSGTTMLTLPTTSGTVLTNGTNTNFPAGSVIQVVGSTDQTRVNTASTSFVALGTSATITPKSTSSKILIIACTQCYTNNPSGHQAYYTLYRGATNLGDATDGFGWLANAEAVGGSIHISYLDSPSTTSATTYALYGRSSNAAATVEFSGSSGIRHSIVLMEIAV
jgi:hypothetical protein